MYKSIVTGAFGQDGYFLTELLSKEKISEIVCCGGSLNKISSDMYSSSKIKILRLNLLNDYEIVSLIKSEKPDIIYNLAGFSSPLDSWDYPSEALHTNGFSVLTFLESIKNYSPKTKFFNACSAKIFSQKIEGAHTVNSSVDPSEPYGLGKYLGFQLINQYRNRYGLFACSGILYNHESHLKNENFVVYKICKNALKLKVGKIKKFDLYNLDSEIDFGDPRDYVRAMVLIMRQNKPEDMIISSNVSISIRDICLLVGDLLQIDNILDYVNVKDKNKKKIFPLRGDNTRLHEIGWTPKYSLKDTLTYMLENISITS